MRKKFRILLDMLQGKTGFKTLKTQFFVPKAGLEPARGLSLTGF